MSYNRLIGFILCAMLCLYAVPCGAESTISVTVFQYDSSGKKSEAVYIRGSCDSGQAVGISAVDSSGKIIYLNEVSSDENGVFEASFVPDDFTIGDIKVTAAVASQPNVVATDTLNGYVNPNKDSKNEMTSFSILGFQGTISGTDITVNLPSYYVVTELVPIFSIPSTAKAYIITGSDQTGDYRKVEQISGRSVVDFTNPVTYTVVAENGSFRNYRVTVNVAPAPTPTSKSGSPGGTSGKGSSGGGIPYTQPAQPPKVSFVDIDSVPWSKAYIETLASKGVVSGDGSNRFYPNKNVTREEFAKMLISALGFDYKMSTVNFYDVPTGAWYYRYVAAASNYGIINGIDEENFGVGLNITREDMATMAYRAAKAKGIALPRKQPRVDFVDNDEISDYAREGVSAMQQADIINGTGDGRFAPKLNATRAQAAKIIYLLCENIIGNN